MITFGTVVMIANTQDYTIENNNLIIVPAPVASLANGLWLFYAKIPTPMVGVNTYPFSGSTQEYTHLSMFDMVIISYAAWKINPMIGKITDSNLSLQEYFKVREEKAQLLRRRPDVSASPDASFKGRL